MVPSDLEVNTGSADIDRRHLCGAYLIKNIPSSSRLVNYRRRCSAIGV